MKVLYLSNANGADYQCDLVFHGLRSLLGPDCVDVNKIEFMYQGWPHPPFHSLYALLPNIYVDRDDIQNKIQTNYFDLIVYGSIQRYREHFDLVKSVYPTNRIIFIDGEDDHSTVDYVGAGIYFKRELTDQHHPSIMPIQFGVPKEKIRPIDLSRKSRLMAHCDPRDRSTYVYYDSESRYYDQYSDAYFGYTMKKGGWDAMRHHEIIAAGSIPYFENFRDCPANTLYKFNRMSFYCAEALHDDWERTGRWEDWLTLARKLQKECLMTTESMAKYILDTAGVS